jgi:hypothetical protein
MKIQPIAIAASMLCVVAGSVSASPNHLEPIAPYDPDGYYQAVFQSFIGKQQPQLWMIELPSFDVERAVFLRHNVEYDPNDHSPPALRNILHEEWVIEYVIAKESIWRWKDIDKDTKILDIKPTDKLERHRTTVPKFFAELMQETWLNVLKLTRYPDEDDGGWDRTAFLFYCHDDPFAKTLLPLSGARAYFGKTWSPQSGLPATLVELGHKLSGLAQADGKEKEALQREAVELARKITQEAAAQQKKS